MDERVSAQTKKCVCFIKDPGRVTSLLISDAACVALTVWMLSDLDPRATGGCPVQDVIVWTARPSKAEN